MVTNDLDPAAVVAAKQNVAFNGCTLDQVRARSLCNTAFKVYFLEIIVISYFFLKFSHLLACLFIVLRYRRDKEMLARPCLRLKV